MLFGLKNDNDFVVYVCFFSAFFFKFNETIRNKGKNLLPFVLKTLVSRVVRLQTQKKRTQHNNKIKTKFNLHSTQRNKIEIEIVAKTQKKNNSQRRFGVQNCRYGQE